MKEFMGLNDIPRDAIILLYGAGDYGQKALLYFKALRPDLKVAGCLDCLKEDTHSSPPVYKYPNKGGKEVDFILITTTFEKEVSQRLDQNNEEYYSLGQEGYDYIYAFSHKDNQS